MTEAQALASIVVWSEDSPGWQRDALRRLATGNPLAGAEIDELVAICKGHVAANPVTAGVSAIPLASMARSISVAFIA